MRKITLIITILSGAFILSGCAGWRTTGKIQTVEMPAKFLNAGDSTSQLNEKWWLDFSDPVLDSLMESAFTSNLSLEQTYQRVQQYHEALKSARSSWFPAISVNAKIQDNGDLTDKATPVTGVNLDTWDVKLSAAYELDVWGRLSANRGAAIADLEANREDLDAFLISLSAQVSKTYFRIVELNEQVALLDEIIASWEDYLSLVSSRYLNGIVSSVDVYQAEINLSGAIARREQTATTLAITEHAFMALLGEYPDDDLVWLRNAGLPDTTPGISAGLPSELVQRRPDVRAAYYRMTAADKRWAEAVASKFPTFSLTGQVGGSSEQLKDALDPDAMVWNAIGSLVLPVFEGGKRSANARRAEAAYREVAARYRDAVIQSFGDVEDALVKNHNQRIYVNELENQLTSAEKLLEAATDRYMRGLSTYLQVVNAQTTYYNTRSSLISARRELVDYYIELATALGGSWTTEASKNLSLTSESEIGANK